MTGIASKSQLRMSYLRFALFTVPAILLLGTVSGRLANSSYSNAWFAALQKPAIMPPGWLFGAAWTLLYILLGLAIAMILNARGARGRGLAITLFVAQLLLNFAWSPVFFAMHKIGTALVIIIAMLLLAGATTFLFWRIRKNAALLMLPYLAWLLFATVLTQQIGARNPDAENLVPGTGGTDILLSIERRGTLMQSENRIFEDLVKVMNGAAGTFAGMTREAQAGFRERAREWVGGLDMIGRDEFEAVKAMAVAAREENQLLRARLDALEAATAPAGGRQV